MSQSPSADRLAEVLSAGALQPPAEGAADSAPPPAQAAPTDISAAAVADQRVVSSVSEGVASAGLPPQVCARRRPARPRLRVSLPPRLPGVPPHAAS